MKVIFILLIFYLSLSLAATGAASMSGGSASGTGIIDIGNYSKSGSAGPLNITGDTIMSNDNGIIFAAVLANFVTDCISPNFPSIQFYDVYTNTILNTIILSESPITSVVFVILVQPNTTIKLRLSSSGCTTTVDNVIFTLEFPISVV